MPFLVANTVRVLLNFRANSVRVPKRARPSKLSNISLESTTCRYSDAELELGRYRPGSHHSADADFSWRFRPDEGRNGGATLGNRPTPGPDRPQRRPRHQAAPTARRARQPRVRAHQAALARYPQPRGRKCLIPGPFFVSSRLNPDQPGWFRGMRPVTRCAAPPSSACLLRASANRKRSAREVAVGQV
jgi:hypothetical protein